MIHQYRKRHLYIWSVLSLVLPIAFLLAWMAIPEHPGIAPRSADAALNLLSSAEIKEIAMGTDLFLSVSIDQPTETPGCLILLADSISATPATSLLLGQLRGMGNYKFRLSETVTNSGQYLLFYDPFEKTVIHYVQL